jgi:hypothetical protein
MPTDRRLHVIRGRVRHTFQQRGATHDHAGHAITALHRVLRDESFLHRVQRIALRQTFDGGHRPGAGIDRKQHAGCDRRAVEPDRAGVAGTPVAADLCAGQIEWTAQHIGKCAAWFQV